MIEFPLTITKSTRLFGGEELVYFGNRLFKINIPENSNYGQRIKMAKMGSLISPSLKNHDIRFKLTEQHSNLKRRNIYMGLPIKISDLKTETNVEVEIKHKTYQIKVPANSKVGKVLRLKDVVSEINYGNTGHLYLLIHNKPVTPHYKQKQSDSETFPPEVEVVSNYGDLYEVDSEPIYNISITFGFPQIIQIKFERVSGGKRTVRKISKK